MQGLGFRASSRGKGWNRPQLSCLSFHEFDSLGSSEFQGLKSFYLGYYVRVPYFRKLPFGFTVFAFRVHEIPDLYWDDGFSGQGCDMSDLRQFDGKHTRSATESESMLNP